VEMPTAERAKLFATIARRGFEKDFYSHDEVFNEIRQSPSLSVKRIGRKIARASEEDLALVIEGLDEIIGG